MAQTGYSPILIYSSSTATNTPLAANLTNSALGSELAINIADGKLFYKDSGGAIQVIGWKVVPTTAGGTGLTSYTSGDTLYYSAGSTLSKLGIGSSGYYMSSSGTAPQWSAPAALTVSNDTNVTLTVGGSASTALLNAASVTAGWTGLLSIARGGTNSNATPTAGGVGYGTGTAHAYSAAGTSGQALLSGAAGAPTWGTLGTGAGGTGLTSFTVNGILYASSSSVLATSSAFTFDGTNVGFTGNLIPGTAAKGINFTANTPAAGMTSQLLNWYEEGTWTPTGNGVTLSSATGTYIRIGKTVTVFLDITMPVTANGSQCSFGGLPFTVGTSGGMAIGYTTNTNAVTFNAGGGGTSLNGYLLGGTALSNATYSGARIIGSCTYSV